MKLSEVFHKAGIEQDSKARRILNTSTARANITADEIEAGIPLERLDAIGAPTYRYTTQITIHGILPDFDTDARPGGFKAIFKNGNGTLGVRYVAIDATKKRTICDASRLSPGKWTAHMDSIGLTVYRFFEAKEECIAAYKAFPKDLICGSVTAGAGAMGGFYVVAYVGAIPVANLWTFIQSLWQIPSVQAFDDLTAEREADSEARRVAHQVEMDKRRADTAEKKAKLAAETNLRKLTRIPAAPCQFAVIRSSYSEGPQLRQFTLRKRGPNVCIASQPYPTATEPAEFKKFDALWRKSIEAAITDGHAFVIPAK